MNQSGKQKSDSGTEPRRRVDAPVRSAEIGAGELAEICKMTVAIASLPSFPCREIETVATLFHAFLTRYSLHKQGYLKIEDFE